MRLHPASWRLLAAALIVAVPVLGALIASGRADEDNAESAVRAPSRVAIKDGVVILTLTAEEQQNAGIATAPPSPAPTQSVVIGYGSVLGPAGLTDLSARYQDAVGAVQTAEAKLTVARAAYERAKLLHQDQQNVSTAQLQDAEGAFRIDQTALAAAQSRLNNVMASARQDWGNELGEALFGQAPLIADLVNRRVYLVRVTLPSGQGIPVPPASATTRLNGGPDIPLDFVSPATSADPKLQGFSYFYKASGQSGVLPGFHLEVSLTTQPTQSRMVVVPEAAIIWLHGKAWVYRRTGATTFERQKISPDRAAPGGGYIVSDLTSDAQIVVRGAQMLLSEEFRAQAPIED